MCIADNNSEPIHLVFVLIKYILVLNDALIDGSEFETVSHRLRLLKTFYMQYTLWHGIDNMFISTGWMMMG